MILSILHHLDEVKEAIMEILFGILGGWFFIEYLRNVPVREGL